MADEESILQKHVGSQASLRGTAFESGGCINNALRINTDAGTFFLKWQVGIPAEMFEKEAEGLRRLEAAGRAAPLAASGIQVPGFRARCPDHQLR